MIFKKILVLRLDVCQEFKRTDKGNIRHRTRVPEQVYYLFTDFRGYITMRRL